MPQRTFRAQEFLPLFFRGFVPFLSLVDFLSRDKNLQVTDIQYIASGQKDNSSAIDSNHHSQPPMETFMRIAQLLEVNLDDLVRYEELPRKTKTNTYEKNE